MFTLVCNKATGDRLFSMQTRDIEPLFQRKQQEKRATGQQVTPNLHKIEYDVSVTNPIKWLE